MYFLCVNAIGIRFFESSFGCFRYQIFGDVFEEAVRTGLPAVQTQHPGFYYQQAAQYAVLRKKTALQVCKVYAVVCFVPFINKNVYIKMLIHM